jgi:hypothetical protein
LQIVCGDLRLTLCIQQKEKQMKEDKVPSYLAVTDAIYDASYRQELAGDFRRLVEDCDGWMARQRGLSLPLSKKGYSDTGRSV